MFLRQLQYLREIERHKSFSKAASACGVSQPALSRAIRQLEDELGVVIINRKKKVFGITSQGARVLKWANDILRGVSELRHEVSVARRAIAGIIKIGVIPTAVHIVTLLLEVVQKSCGDFASEVYVLPNVAIIEKLVSKELDIGVMYHDQCPQEKFFNIHNLYEEQQVLVASDAFQLPEGTDISWTSASALPFAFFTKTMRCRQLVDIAFQTSGLEPIIRLETDSLELIHAQVMAGNVASILPLSSFPIKSIPLDTLQMRRLPGFSPGSVGAVRLNESLIKNFGSEVWENVIKISLKYELDASKNSLVLMRT